MLNKFMYNDPSLNKFKICLELFILLKLFHALVRLIIRVEIKAIFTPLPPWQEECEGTDYKKACSTYFRKAVQRKLVKYYREMNFYEVSSHEQTKQL